MSARCRCDICLRNPCDASEIPENRSIEDPARPCPDCDFSCTFKDIGLAFSFRERRSEDHSAFAVTLTALTIKGSSRLSPKTLGSGDTGSQPATGTISLIMIPLPATVDENPFSIRKGLGLDLETKARPKPRLKSRLSESLSCQHRPRPVRRQNQRYQSKHKAFTVKIEKTASNTKIYQLQMGNHN